LKNIIYISLEGCDGAGKTTLEKLLYDYFLKKGLKVLRTKEFGSPLSEFCVKMREAALSDHYKTDELAGQIAFAAIARQHQESVIKPNLKNPEVDIILSDRGIDSNYAYGPVHLNNQKTINELFQIAYKDAKLPDITIFLNVPPELTKKRRDLRSKEVFNNGGTDRVEKKGQEFQELVRQNFLKRAKKDKKRIKVINITENMRPEMVLDEVVQVISNHYKPKSFLVKLMNFLRFL
jgi:dTMP kinase